MFLIGGIVLLVVLVICRDGGSNSHSTKIPTTQQTTRVTSELYGVLQDGRNVTRYTLRNGHMQVDILNFGGIVTKIEAPDKDGNISDILLGFDSLQDYDRQTVLLGAVVGRYANLIADNRFRLDGVWNILDVDDELGNNGSNCRGFSKRLWDSHIEEDTLVLTYNSPDGEGGFPGNVNVAVTYDLTKDNALVINYRATTDKPTVINLTNRLFFNLNGHASGDIKDHILRIVAEHYTPLDKHLVPTGEISPVRGTMYDTRSSFYLGPRLPRLPGDRGFDINYAFGNSGWDKHMASVTHRRNGRTIDVYSTEPGLQFNTGYHLQGIMGKEGVVYKHYGGLLLEAQLYPNSPNEVRFPPPILRPNKLYTQTTKYVFGDSREKTPLDYMNNPSTTPVALHTINSTTMLSVTQDNGHTRILAIVLPVAALVVLCVLLGIVIYRKSIYNKSSALLRRLFDKAKDRTNRLAEQQTVNAPSVTEIDLVTGEDLHQDPTCQNMEIRPCRDEEQIKMNKYRTTAVAKQPYDYPDAMETEHDFSFRNYNPGRIESA